MKRLLLFFSLLTISFFSFGQIWNTQINYVDTEYLGIRPGLIKTLDGNPLFIYRRSDNPPILNNGFTYALAEYNQEGELIWEKFYDHNEVIGGQSGLFPRSLTIMPNGDFISSGNIRLEDQAYIYRTNSLGDSILYQTYTQYSTFRQICALDSNHIIVFAIEEDTNNHVILKINISSAGIVGYHLIPNSTAGSDIILSSLAEHYFMFTEMEDSIQLYRISLNGIIQAQNTIAYPEGFSTGEGFRTAKHLALDGEGFFIFDEAVLAINEDLSIKFSIPFNEESLNAAALNVHSNEYILPTSDGGCLISGTINFPNGNYFDQQIYMIKLDQNGQEEWNNIYGFWVFASNYAPALLEAEDGYVFIRHHLVTGNIYMNKILKNGSLDPSAIHDLVEVDRIKVYPNPANKQINLISDNNPNVSILQIYNLAGQLIRTITDPDLNQDQIDISTLDSGQYFIRGLTKEAWPVFLGQFTKL